MLTSGDGSWCEVDSADFFFTPDEHGEIHVYLDGSFHHYGVVADGRAGWVAVQVTRCRRRIKKLVGPVWSPMAQSALSAEWRLHLCLPLDLEVS